MKKYLTMLSALIMMGACSASPETDISNAIKRFNSKRYFAILDDGTVSNTLLQFRNRSLYSGDRSENADLHSVDGDRFILQSSDKPTIFVGMTLQNQQVILHGYKSGATSKSIEDINWDTTIGIDDTQALVYGKTK